MEIVKKIIIRSKENEYINKKRTTLTPTDNRVIRWVLKFEDQETIEEKDLLEETTV